MADVFHIQAPDGSLVEFPAGTSDEVVKSVMAKAYGGPGQQAGAEQPKDDQPRSTLESIRDAIHAPTRLLENGIMLGLGDRARALISTGVGDGSYGDNLKKEQDSTSDYEAAHPVAAPVIEGVGSVAAPLGAIGAASRATGLGTKMLAGAGAGGAIGGVQGALDSKDYTDLPQVAKNAAMGAGISGAVGALMPGAGKAIGAGYNAVADAVRGNAAGMSRGASQHLVNAMVADGPAAVQSRLAELGPDAMLGDAGPAFLGKLQGASLNSDEGRSIAQTALRARNQATDARIRGDVDAAMGPAEDPVTATANIRDYRSQQDAQNYGRALNPATAPQIDTTGVLADLGHQITYSTGLERQALQNLQGQMMRTLPGGRVVPQSDPVILHKLKGEMDNVIQYDQPGLGIPGAALSQRNGTLQHMRFLLNDALENQVPGYAAANATSAALARRGEAVQAGTQYLGSGKTTPFPERFATEFNQLEPGEQAAFAKGTRGEIGRQIGTKANDLQALRTALQGDGGFNTAKLATVHGQDAAGALVNSVDRNLAFRDTYNKVVENSQTAQRQAAASGMKKAEPNELPIINPGMTTVGGALSAVKKYVASPIYKALQPDQTRSYGEIASALTAQGPARDARVQSIIDALDRRNANAAVAPAAGNTTSLLAAIAANGYANRRRNQGQ